jgi:glycosyltransferase involved in cell wall biosynthesis
MKKVSVIIPVYNCAEYIKESLLSAISQTYSTIEIIIVNDGSTDNSLDIIKEISSNNNNIKVFSQSNQGPSAARNFGISQATGDYIQFLDADDIILPFKLEKQVALLEKHPEVAVCHCNYIQFSYHNESDNYCANTDFDSKNQLIEVLTRWSHSLMIPPIAALFRSSIIQDHNLQWDSNLWGSEDWNLYLRILTKGHKFIHLPELLAMHRGRPGSLSQDRVKMALSDLRVLDKLENDLLQNETVFKRKLVDEVRCHAKSRLGYALLETGDTKESIQLIIESIQKDSWKYQIKSIILLLLSRFIKGRTALEIWHAFGHVYKESQGRFKKIFQV